MISEDEIRLVARGLGDEIVARLRGFMREQGVNQHELARRLCVSDGYVSGVLNGRKNLTLKTIASFANALGYRFNLAIKGGDLSEPVIEDSTDASVLFLGA